jgi:hypothetical protein
MQYRATVHEARPSFKCNSKNYIEFALRYSVSIFVILIHKASSEQPQSNAGTKNLFESFKQENNGKLKPKH